VDESTHIVASVVELNYVALFGEVFLIF